MFVVLVAVDVPDVVFDIGFYARWYLHRTASRDQTYSVAIRTTSRTVIAAIDPIVTT